MTLAESSRDTDAAPSTSNHCDNCGAAVSARWRRVMAVDGEVRARPDCSFPDTNPAEWGGGKRRATDGIAEFGGRAPRGGR